MALWHKVSGVWKNVPFYHKVSGVWKNTRLWHKVSGVWKSITAFFTPPGGNYNNYQFGANASYTLTCSEAATWTYTLDPGGTAGGSATQPSGYVGTSITFNQLLGGPGTIRFNSWTIQANISGLPAENFTVYLKAENP